MFKKHKVVMLPTEKSIFASKLMILKDQNTGILSFEKLNNLNSEKLVKPQHLYILSDDEIKEGDWVYSNKGTPVLQKVDKPTLQDKREYGWRKIIATTDPELRVQNKEKPNLSSYVSFSLGTLLPTLSETFIQEYCELGGVDEVKVEYIMAYEDHLEGREFVPRPAGYILNITPDNTINIKKVKDSWNRKEVEDLIRRFSASEYNEILQHQVNKWIEENL